MQFSRQLDQWAHAVGSVRPADFVKKILDESGYQEDLERQETLEAEGRLENLSELLNVVEDFEKDHSGGISEFLEQVSLVGDTDTFNSSSGMIPMMTLHLAKGLEFPVAFLVGMEEGLFPHSRSLEEPAGIEEERRLCYVGLTRARQRVILTHAVRRHLYGGDQYPIPSRFLAEIPETLLERRSGILQEEGESQVVSDVDSYSQISSALRIGIHVRHPTFGVGVVKKREGHGERQKVTVYFQDGRVKTLMVKFAGLEVL